MRPSKIKNPLVYKGNVNCVRRQSAGGETVFANYPSDRGSVSEYTESLRTNQDPRTAVTGNCELPMKVP